MIKSYVVASREIDDVEAVVNEVLSKLDIEKNLLKNSLGIITCFSEFVDTGAVKAVCEALPFDCIGSTTTICSSAKETDQVLFALTVLTSDDCHFVTSLIPVGENYDEDIASTLTSLLKNNPGKPELVLGYFPLMRMISGDMLLASINKLIDDTPLFGTVATDHTMDYTTACTIHNGNAYREAVALCFIYGQVNYSFEIASLDEDMIKKQRAIITESNGNLLTGVNGKTAQEYLEEIGITKSELESGIGIIPLVIDHKNGTRPVARAAFGLTPDGHVVCGGSMPIGATIAIGRVKADDVISTITNALTNFVEKDCLIISYSCMARFIALGLNHTAEADKMSELVGDTNYLFANSGGEICPLPDVNGKLRNYFHNFTNVFCKIK